MRNLVCLTALALGCALPPRAGGLDVAAYEKSSLVELFDAHDPSQLGLARDAVVIMALSHRYSVRAACGCATRELRAPAKRLFEARDSKLGAPLATTLFHTEVEVQQDGTRFWLPIQDSLLADWREELVAGAPVELLIAFIGSAGPEQIYVINGFQALKRSEG